MINIEKKQTKKISFEVQKCWKKSFALTKTTGISMSFKYFFPIANMAFFGQKLKKYSTFYLNILFKKFSLCLMSLHFSRLPRVNPITENLYLKVLNLILDYSHCNALRSVITKLPIISGLVSNFNNRIISLFAKLQNTKLGF